MALDAILAALATHEADARERVAAEREKCAKVVEDFDFSTGRVGPPIVTQGRFAAAIRALPPGDVQGGAATDV